jgi:hypothetical protein
MAGALRIIALLSVLAAVLAVGSGRLPLGARADDTIRVETRAVVGSPPVTIDIEPGWKGNDIILARSYLGVVPVAIITTPEFDATTVDPNTVVLAGAHTKWWEAVDVDRDGDKDLLLTFKTQETSLAPGDKEACPDGQTRDGTAIHGCDSVRVISLDRWWKPITAAAGAIVLDGGAGDNVSEGKGQTAALGASSAPAALPPAGSSGFALWGDGWPWWVGLAMGVVAGALIVGGVGWVFAGKRRNGPNP